MLLFFHFGASKKLYWLQVRFKMVIWYCVTCQSLLLLRVLLLHGILPFLPLPVFYHTEKPEVRDLKTRRVLPRNNTLEGLTVQLNIQATHIAHPQPSLSDSFLCVVTQFHWSGFLYFLFSFFPPISALFHPTFQGICVSKYLASHFQQFQNTLTPEQGVIYNFWVA